ncbi:MAG: S4 domain-containing protein [Chromatiales bacterium]|jgi:ribosome-associated heat shock protein Hsp15
MPSEPAQTVRLDKWLWAARFFKTRALAVEAINGGKVHLNGQRTKPGKDVRVGARLRVHKGEQEWDLLVTALSDRRGPASQARELYEETETSIRRREAAAEQRRLTRASSAQPVTRPNKRDRRLIHRFKQDGR